MRIMILGTLPKRHKKYTNFGGAEKNMINLANFLAERGHDVCLCAVEGDDLIYPVTDKVRVILTRNKIENKVALHLKTFIRTRKSIKEFSPDIIIGFWLHPTLYAMTLKNCPKIIYCERNNPDTIYSDISKKLLKRVLKKSSGLIFQTHGVMEQFSDLQLKDKSIVVMNPIYIDKNEFHYIENKDNRIVSIGRLSEQKNQKLLIDAFAQIEKKHPDLIMEIYGEGELRNILQDQIDKYHLENKIFLKGTSKDVLKFIHSAKIFILSSLYEGMPNVLIEAQGLGVPCISSDCPPGGPASIICNKRTGLLFENNDLQSLVEQLSYALEYPQKMQEMSRLAYETVYINHDLKTIFEKWECFIEKVLKEK